MSKDSPAKYYLDNTMKHSMITLKDYKKCLVKEISLSKEETEKKGTIWD